MKKMIAIALALMLCVSALSVVAFADDGVTITIEAHESWDACYVYTWGATGMGEWPGMKLTAGADGKYTVTISGAFDGMVVSAGNGKPQTVDIKDLDLTKGEILITVGEVENGKHTYSVSYDGGETTEKPEDKPVVIDAYYVAGTADLCNGKGWEVNAEANKMTKGEDGIWTITYANVPAGEHKLKVTAGNWDNCWGAIKNGDADGNIVFTLEEATEVVVKFNPANGKVTVLVNGEDMNPASGDMSLAGVSIALLAATAGLVAVVSKKKEF
jgi:hypothetical protein